MRLPKRGQKGFTLIELLIVVAILGVLAAVVIPAVMQFIGAGEEEAIDTEYANMTAMVSAMMVDNELSTLPDPVDIAGGSATNNMAEFPDTSAIGTDPLVNKVNDPDGVPYTVASGDKAGYILYQHDINGGDGALSLVNYSTTQYTSYYYTVDTAGTVTQWDGTNTATATKLN